MKALKIMIKTSLSKLFKIGFLILFPPLSFTSTALYASFSTEKTPNDVYQEVLRLSDDVKQLRKKNKITTPWPTVTVSSGHKPRHVFQKALEVLGKINSYRINIVKTGGITIPPYPGRDITPNEVFDVVLRLHQELGQLSESSEQHIDHKSTIEAASTIKTPNHVYAALSEVSIALEETLNLRGITPSEVYTRSLEVIERVNFLRRSQNLPMNIAKPARRQGKLPNHALYSVQELLTKIQKAEQNLWMEPIKLAKIPKRVITPSDVYDAMGVVLAELQSIQFRLGLERTFVKPAPQKDKTPSDVIQNTEWASAQLPEFRLDEPLLQYDRFALQKTPSHVFSITEHILKRLSRYRNQRGIRVPPRKARVIHGLEPRHVYSKALEIMEKINALREQQHLGSISVPLYPIRTITPSEVFDLTLRLDSEFALIHQQDESKMELYGTEVNIQEFEDKNPSDVFYNMQKISNLLDTILGSEGFTPNDVYLEARLIKQDLEAISHHLGNRIPEELWSAPILRPHTEPKDVLAQAQKVLKLIIKAKRRAGMFRIKNISVTPDEEITPTIVYNEIRLIKTELNEFKVFLNINTQKHRSSPYSDKRPADTLQVLEGVTAALQHLLHIGETRL